MGEQHKLIERLKSVRVGSAKWTNALNRLLDAARTEGRGEGEPADLAVRHDLALMAIANAVDVLANRGRFGSPDDVLGQLQSTLRALRSDAAAEPALSGWVVGNGDADRWRAWDQGNPVWVADRAKATRYARREDAEAVHAEDEDAWCVQPLYASPIREPEISREAVEAALVEYEWALSTAGWPKTAAEITARTVDAILNLAPVGLKADFTKALPGGALDDTTFGAVEDALDRADAPMQAENGRWLTLPERIAALALERPKAFQDCDVCGGDCAGANPPVNACPRLLAPVGGRGEGWRPIETAPKDGTTVLVAHASNGAIFDAAWDDDAKAWTDGSMDAWDEFITYEPSHWQPLPPPPQEQGGMK